MNLGTFEKLFSEKMQDVCNKHPDPSHDMLHVQRVVSNARKLASIENAAIEIVAPAAYLHDLVYISKSDSRRSQASQLSAMEAGSFLKQIAYPEQFIEPICHAIEAHSFSASHSAKSLEAKVVQDADRLDALGAIGIARCLAFSGLAMRPIYNFDDPFCNKRIADDSTNTLDHFFLKLLKLPDKMQTAAGKEEANKRLKIMKLYLEALKTEIATSPDKVQPLNF
jgi:uncharacterized protein